MDNYVLITGASGGIGLEFAKIFASKGYNLLLAARSLQHLQTVSDLIYEQYRVKAIPIQIDLSKEGSVIGLYNNIKSMGIQVDILVNNAGYGDNGLFYETETSSDIGMIQLNITSLFLLTKLFSKEMSVRNKGMILNVASVASFMPGPYMALYYATKAFVLNFSIAAAKELKGTGVTITTLCPGPTKSNFFHNANASGKRVSSMFIMPEAKEVAEYGVKQLFKKKVFAVHGFSNKFMVFLTRILPVKIVVNVVEMIQKD